MARSGINPELLQTFLLDHESPINEIMLFKHFFPHVPFDLTNYQFFKAHFLIHHNLYKLKTQLIQQGYLMFIQLSSVYILKIPEAGICSWFSETKISFCGNSADNKFCSYHQKINRELIEKGAVDLDPLQEYYLDLKNLEQLDEQSFRQFADSGIYLADNIMKVQQALLVFTLGPGAPISRITSRYRYLVKESHPDSGGGAAYSFQEIKEAYDVLAAWKNLG